MDRDPIVEEVRETRREIESTCGSPEAYYKHLEGLQQKWPERLVRREPQRVERLKVAS
jgi:hypothetical protein